MNALDKFYACRVKLAHSKFFFIIVKGELIILGIVVASNSFHLLYFFHPAHLDIWSKHKIKGWDGLASHIFYDADYITRFAFKR